MHFVLCSVHLSVCGHPPFSKMLIIMFGVKIESITIMIIYQSEKVVCVSVNRGAFVGNLADTGARL